MGSLIKRVLGALRLLGQQEYFIEVREGHRTIFIQDYDEYRLYLNDYPEWQRQNGLYSQFSDGRSEKE